MASLTFITEDVCALCGHRERGRQFAWGCRINKGSIKIEGSLNARPWKCVECGGPPIRSAPDRVRLDDESYEKVRVIRQRRGWVGA